MKREAASIAVPVFMTAGKSEARQWRGIFKAIGGVDKTGFVPNGAGRHGSSALLSSDAPEYWAAVDGFLSMYF